MENTDPAFLILWFSIKRTLITPKVERGAFYSNETLWLRHCFQFESVETEKSDILWRGSDRLIVRDHNNISSGSV